MHRTHPHTLLSSDQNHFDAVILAWMLKRTPNLRVQFGFANGEAHNLEDPVLRHLAIDLSNCTGHSFFVVSSCEARDLGEPVGRIGYQGAVEFYVYCTCDPDVTALGESLKAFGKVMITSKGLIRYYDPESELFSRVHATNASSIGHIKSQGKGNTLYLSSGVPGVFTCWPNSKVVIEINGDTVVYRNFQLVEAARAKSLRPEIIKELLEMAEEGEEGLKAAWKMVADCIPGGLSVSILVALKAAYVNMHRRSRPGGVERETY